MLIALDSGKAEGAVTSRTVKATFSALERYTPSLGVDQLPNPFPYPHNLSWYFGSCACPHDVRVFATMLGKGHLRVWSVAKDELGWKVLTQVFGASSQEDAVATVKLDSGLPSTRLKHFYLKSVGPASLDPSAVDGLIRPFTKRDPQDLGVFVEVNLGRRF